MTYQKIFYGAPGTGKSFCIDDMLNHQNIDLNYIYRVTFHPEYSYADFIGQILPVVTDSDNGKNISYEFVKGIFTKCIEHAYQNTSKNVFLILEEMSRGDVAAIFGDIFQLLDREQSGPKKGFSKYFISNSLLTKDITYIEDDKLKLPPNLIIYGTVNTSDQNVFVMDTAFKRRFDWEYVSTRPIRKSGMWLNNPELEITNSNNEKVDTNWIVFYNSLNKFITDRTFLELGEDKQIGQFFIEFDLNNTDDAKQKNLKTIQNKLLNYLWNDVHKASFKRGILLFSERITNFSELYEAFGNRENIFSVQFFECFDNIRID